MFFCRAFSPQQDLRFRVHRVQDSGFGVWVQGLGFRALGFGFRDLGFGFKVWV